MHNTGERLVALPEEERPGSVIVGIMTDRHENSIREYTHPAMKAQINWQEETYNWTFLHMGANQDAIEVGERLGVAREGSMTYTDAGTAAATAASSDLVAGLRTMTAAGAPPAQGRRARLHQEAARRRSAVSQRRQRPAGSRHEPRPTPWVSVSLVWGAVAAL